MRRTAFKCENTDRANLHTSTNHEFFHRWLTKWANTRNIWQLPVLLLSPPAPSVNRFSFRRHPHSAATCPSFHHFNTTSVPLGSRLLSPLRTLSLSLPLDHSLFLLMLIHSACPVTQSGATCGHLRHTLRPSKHTVGFFKWSSCSMILTPFASGPASLNTVRMSRNVITDVKNSQANSRPTSPSHLETTSGSRSTSHYVTVVSANCVMLAAPRDITCTQIDQIANRVGIRTRNARKRIDWYRDQHRVTYCTHERQGVS